MGIYVTPSLGRYCEDLMSQDKEGTLHIVSAQEMGTPEILEAQECTRGVPWPRTPQEWLLASGGPLPGFDSLGEPH